eukprot:jgi/Mesvir1/1261/Mv09549-RA.1
MIRSSLTMLARLLWQVDAGVGSGGGGGVVMSNVAAVADGWLDRNVLLDPSRGLLSRPVLQSLAEQLSVDLRRDTLLKLTWLRGVVAYLRVRADARDDGGEGPTGTMFCMNRVLTNLKSTENNDAAAAAGASLMEQHKAAIAAAKQLYDHLWTAQRGSPKQAAPVEAPPAPASSMWLGFF